MSDRRRRCSEAFVPATLGLTGLSMMGLALAVLLLSGCAGGPPPGGREPEKADGGGQEAPIARLFAEAGAGGDRIDPPDFGSALAAAVGGSGRPARR